MNHQPRLEAPGADRVLDWAGCHNVRDAGGLSAGNGHIRRGALVRSDLLSRLTPAGRQALIDHGVRTVVDIRSAQEVARDWELYPFHNAGTDGGAKVRYLNVSFTMGHDEHAWAEISAAYHAAHDREELNRLDLEANQRGLAAIVAAIADAVPGGVLVHCHAGKDRTGMVVALVLALAGAPDAEIADDYALTGLNLEPLIGEWLDQMSDQEAERARLRELALPRAEAMLETLDYLRARYGSAERYLLHAGVTAAQIERLRARLVTRE